MHARAAVGRDQSGNPVSSNTGSSSKRKNSKDVAGGLHVDALVSKMRNTLAICAALMLLGCESSPKHASIAKTLGTATTYLVCLHKAAIQLDDHVSDVSAIAPAVAQQCVVEFHAGTEAVTQGMSPLTAAILEHKAERENLKLATIAIREERKETRKGTLQPDSHE
jgi:hypothetical protein